MRVLAGSILMLAASVCILAATFATPANAAIPGFSAVALGVLGLFVMINGIGENNGPPRSG
jgi:hypothetical protein